MNKKILFIVASMLFPFLMLNAQVQLVKDVNTGSAVNGSNPIYFLNVAGTIYFTANDGSNGGELWKSDGTVPGTVVVKDIYPGANGGGPGTAMVNVGSTVYFSGSDGSNGSELWKSDGTAGGTVLVKDIYPGPNGSSISGLTVMNSNIYFQATDGVNGTELWKSDGTPGGTVMVKDINPGPASSSPYYITAIGNTLYMSATDGTTGYEIWKSDGSTLGTSQVKDINAGSAGSSPQSFVLLGATVYFIANDGATGQELWKTNGTSIGTSLVKDIYPGANGSLLFYNLVKYNSVLAFTAYNGTNGSELWTSDGTSAGTTMVKDINVGAGDGAVGTPVISNNILFFTATTAANGSELWISDGTSVGTGLVKDIIPGATGSSIYFQANTDINGTLYFSADNGSTGRELWRSDGTVGGTVLIKDIYPGINQSFPNYFVAGSTFTLFQADNGTNGTELWKSDGSSAGTIMLKNIRPDVDESYIDDIIAAGSNVYFYAYEPVTGPELWKSDGSTAGTSVVKDIYPGANGAAPNYITAINNKVYFAGSDGINGGELWVSDGTIGGTNLVKDIETGAGGSFPESLVNVNDTLYFFATKTGTGDELWKSDGTAGGTVLVKDIQAGTGGSAWSGEVKNINGKTYMAVQTTTNGVEPWISHGTSANTVLLKDINVPGGSNVNNFIYCNGFTFFGADDGTNGYELWKSDGTTGGTSMVKNIKAGSAGGLVSYFNNGCLSSCQFDIAVLNNEVYFIADDGSGTGGELWKSNGTSAGTVLVKDIYPGSFSSSLASLITIGNTLYFTANDGTNGVELWKTDGSTAGTLMIKDISPGSSSSSPTALANFGGKLFFSAADSYGTELWTSMGTSSTTARVSDIYAGAGSSSPKLLTAEGNTLFFVADNGLIGKELWKLDMPVALTATASVTDVLCNGQTNGAINLTPTGGTGPYTYAWSNSATTQNISGVGAGVYSVTVSDAWGWTSVSSYTVGAPNILSVNLTSYHNVTCNGSNNGALNVLVNGGTPTYSYAWSPGGATSQNISGLTSGFYTVVVTDSHTCTATYTANVSQPAALSGTALINDASCFNSTNGNATINMSVGVSPFTYQWDAAAGSQTTQTASGLGMGTYTVLVSDDSLCTKTFTVTVNQPAALSMSVTSTVDTCGQSDGTVSVVSPSGGTPSYTYIWTPGGAGQSLNGVHSGTYSVTMTDSKGCMKTGSVNVGSVPQRPLNICMVSADSTSTNNIIYWDKAGFLGVDSFIIYREVSTGSYARIGAQSYSALSQFVDVNRSVGPANGDPNIGYYHYKLKIRDTCGNYSVLSPYHTSIFFVDNHNGTFSWNIYDVEGQSTPVANFNLMRDSVNTNDWRVIGSVAGSTTILNDATYATYQSTGNWKVEATGFSCTPTLRLGNNSVQTAIVKSKSNITNNRTSSIKQTSNSNEGLVIYPNPNNGVFVIESNSGKKQSVQIFDVTGKLVVSQLLENGKAIINGADLLQGVYNVCVTGENGTINKKLVIVK